LDLYRRPSGRTAVLVSVLATGFAFTDALSAVQNVPGPPPRLDRRLSDGLLPQGCGLSGKEDPKTTAFAKLPSPKTLYFSRNRPARVSRGQTWR
jgi:hypothetical protein